MRLKLIFGIGLIVAVLPACASAQPIVRDRARKHDHH